MRASDVERFDPPSPAGAVREKSASRAAKAGLAVFATTVPVSIFAAQIGYLVAAVAEGVGWIRRRAFPRTPLDAYLFGYVAAELISFAFSQDRAQNFLYMRRLLILPMFYVAVSVARRETGLAWSVVPFLAVADVLSALGIVRYLMGPSDLVHRVRLWQHVLTTSDLLMMADLVALGILLSASQRRVRWAAAGSVVLITACLVFTYSRGAWLGAFVGTLVALAFARPRTLLPLLAAIAILVVLAPHPLRSRLASVVDLSDPANAERVNMWRAGVEIVRHHPWTGIGDIGTESYYPRYAPRPPRELAGHLHSNLVQLAVTLGIPGLIATLALFVRLLVLLVRGARARVSLSPLSRAVALGALASYVGFQVIGLFEWNFGDAEVALTLWWLVGLAEGLRCRR